MGAAGMGVAAELMVRVIAARPACKGINAATSAHALERMPASRPSASTTEASRQAGGIPCLLTPERRARRRRGRVRKAPAGMPACKLERAGDSKHGSAQMCGALRLSVAGAEMRLTLGL